MSRADRDAVRFVVLTVLPTFAVSTLSTLLRFVAGGGAFYTGERGPAIQLTNAVLPVISGLLVATVVGFAVVAVVERLRPRLRAGATPASLARAAAPLLALIVLGWGFVDLPHVLPTFGFVSVEAVLTLGAAAVALRQSDERFPWSTSLALALAFAYLAGTAVGADLSGAFEELFVAVEGGR